MTARRLLQKQIRIDANQVRLDPKHCRILEESGSSDLLKVLIQCPEVLTVPNHPWHAHSWEPSALKCHSYCVEQGKQNSQ